MSHVGEMIHLPVCILVVFMRGNGFTETSAWKHMNLSQHVNTGRNRSHVNKIVEDSKTSPTCAHSHTSVGIEMLSDIGQYVN